MTASKYFPLHEAYEKNSFPVYDEKYKSDIYRALRAILKDPALTDASSDRHYSLCFETGWSSEERVRWTIYMGTHGEKEIQVTLPYAGSTHEAALLVQMGSHTIEETWDEYKDFWYEDLEKQVAHLEKGNGP